MCANYDSGFFLNNLRLKNKFCETTTFSAVKIACSLYYFIAIDKKNLKLKLYIIFQ